ncbi:MAG: hypothetical protein HYW69_00590, partial [Candidatus Nealsonbacteria bacterium]|nr:hypothetical protein [Candidatus Nealsonbacteria bacterium]
MNNYHAWDIEPIRLETAAKKDLYLNLIGWAILAANTHNVQPWKFIIRLPENIIDISLDKAGILPVSDKDSRQAYISIGCAMENLMLAAKYYGLEPKIEYFLNSLYPLPTIRLIFRDEEKLKFGDPRFIQAMKKRKMNRGKFKPKLTVPKPVLEKMGCSAEELDLVLNFITDAPTRFIIAQIQYKADRIVVAQNDFRYELASYLLPNKTEKARGMPGNTFGLSDEMAIRIHEELKKKGAFDADLAVGFAATNRDGIKSAPLVCVISVKKDDSESWIKAGRAFQKNALLAEINGLSVAILASIVEVEALNGAMRVRLGSPYRPTVIFRMGYPIQEMPHSPRANVEEVTEVI